MLRKGKCVCTREYLFSCPSVYVCMYTYPLYVCMCVRVYVAVVLALLLLNESTNKLVGWLPSFLPIFSCCRLMQRISSKKRAPLVEYLLKIARMPGHELKQAAYAAMIAMCKRPGGWGLLTLLSATGKVLLCSKRVIEINRWE